MTWKKTITIFDACLYVIQFKIRTTLNKCPHRVTYTRCRRRYQLAQLNDVLSIVENALPTDMIPLLVHKLVNHVLGPLLYIRIGWQFHAVWNRRNSAGYLHRNSAYTIHSLITCVTNTLNPNSSCHRNFIWLFILSTI